MPTKRAVGFRRLLSVFVVAASLLYGCSNLNMRCDGAGKGYSCTSVDGPPERHTRSQYQPVWADEYHDIGMEQPRVSELVFQLTNQEREQRGRSSLRHDPTLSQIACWHNQDMLGHNYVRHEDSDGRMPADRVKRQHRRLIGWSGENATGDVGMLRAEGKPDWAVSIMDSWMESTGHRANILRRKYTHLGVCVTKDSLDARATQVFAEVEAYLDQPLPWIMTPGDSVSVSFSLVKADQRPTRYKFAPLGEPADETFQGQRTGIPLTDKLYLPDSTGRYVLRVIIPDNSGRYRIGRGPRVRIQSEGETSY